MAAKYPQHDKLRLVADKTQFLLEFLKEFCAHRGHYLTNKDNGRVPSYEDLVYEFVDVDRWKLEEEKRVMVAGLGKPDGLPHGVSCRCCREKKTCHVCGNKVTSETRCTSGACPECCRECHIHKNTR